MYSNTAVVDCHQYIHWYVHSTALYMLLESSLVVMSTSTSTHCEVSTSTRWVLTQRNTYIYRYSNSWHIPSKTYLVPPISCWLVMAYQQQRTITGSRAGDSTNLISGILPKMWVQNEYSASTLVQWRFARTTRPHVPLQKVHVATRDIRWHVWSRAENRAQYMRNNRHS